MATNRNLLAEQIQRIYSRNIDREDVSRLDLREIKLLITQAVNFLIKPEIFQRGDISGCILASYDIAKQTSGGCDYITLPVVPVSLPKEQGIHRVYPQGCSTQAYIPIQTNDFQIVQGTPSMYIEGQVGYFYEGHRISFTKTVAAIVTVKLVVYDPVNDTDILPIPPEMEAQVIEFVLQQFGLAQMSASAAGAKNERKTNERQLD